MQGARSGRHPPVELLGFDDQKDEVEAWSDVLMGSGQPSAPFVSGIAYHWYAGDHFGKLQAAAARHPHKWFLGTEATYELTRLGDNAKLDSPEHQRWLREGIWSRGEGYAHAIIGDLNAGSSGWCVIGSDSLEASGTESSMPLTGSLLLCRPAPRRIDWNILLDASGGPNHLGNMCDAPMIADPQLGAVYRHPQFYFLGHFSKFMPKGSRRVRIERFSADGVALDGQPPHAEGGSQGIYNLTGTVAYGSCPGGPPQAAAAKRPDGTTALVVLNCGDKIATIRIEVVGRSRNAVQRSVPAHAIQTYILDTV